MNNNPRISIILPTYNGAKYIRKAIESVISQNFFDWELMIINDGSTDNTEEIIEEYKSKDNRIVYIKNDSNLGIQKTFNKGLGEAKREYVARIDDDDEWIDKDKLANQVEFLDNNQDYVLVGTGVIIVDVSSKEVLRYLMPTGDKEIRKKLLGINCFVSSSILFRKVSLDKVGNPESLLEDYDLCLRIGKTGKLANMARYSVKYRLNNTGINSQKKVIRLRENIILTKKYKDKYPGYCKAIIIGYLKIIFYPIFKLLPLNLKAIILILHKRF